MADGTRPRGGPGILGVVVGTLVLAAVITLVFFVGIIALGVLATLFVIGLVVVAVDRLLLALSPRRRQRRAEQGAAFSWQFGRMSPGPLIDTTATEAPVIDARAMEARPEADPPPPGEGTAGTG